MSLEQIVKARRSVRRFTDEPVSRETISKLLELATWAPHAGEAWRFVVVQGAEGKQKLAEACRQEWMTSAAAIQILMLAAVEEGLGTCWIGSFNEGDVARTVNLSFPVRPVALVVLGHPADEPRKRTRRPLEEIASWETFDTTT